VLSTIQYYANLPPCPPLRAPKFPSTKTLPKIPQSVLGLPNASFYRISSTPLRGPPRPAKAVLKDSAACSGLVPAAVSNTGPIPAIMPPAASGIATVPVVIASPEHVGRRQRLFAAGGGRNAGTGGRFYSNTEQTKHELASKGKVGPGWVRTSSSPETPLYIKLGASRPRDWPVTAARRFCRLAGRALSERSPHVNKGFYLFCRQARPLR
jgi:hypothetical protein